MVRAVNRTRRNPDTPQLGAAYGRAFGNAIKASGRGDAKAERRWEQSARTIEQYIDAPDPTPSGFVTFRDRFGNVRHRPIRYSLESANAYDPQEDRRYQEREARYRQADRYDEVAKNTPAALLGGSAQFRLGKRVAGVNKRYAKAAATRAAIKAGTKVSKPRGTATQRERIAANKRVRESKARSKAGR
jgi:hypothetical protein